MRRWVLVFMLLLLPLRGLVGEVMAAQMLQQHVAASVAVHEPHEAHADHGDHHAAPALPGHDCEGHAQAASAQPDASVSPAPADCPTCASCQACSSVALSSSVHAPASARAVHTLPAIAQHSHRSAEPAPAFKPPRG